MKVLLLTPSRHGAMIHYSSQLANELANYVDVTQAVIEGTSQEFFSPNVTLKRFNLPYDIGELLSGTVSGYHSLYREIRTSKYDVIHVTIPSPHLFPLAPLLQRETVFVTIHDVYSHEGEETLRADLTRRIFEQIADGVFVHGDYNRKRFEEKFGKREGLVNIPHGDFSFFNEYCDDRTKYDGGLLFFGRIRPYKGLGTLIKASKEIIAAKEDAKITIAGKGDLPSIPPNLEENFDIRNEYVPEEEVCKLFRGCTSVVLPYTEATQSGIIPIAYSFKKPVIASRVGGIPEVVEHNRTGFLVDSQNHEELSQYSIKMLENKTMARQLGENAHQFKEEKLSWKIVVDRVYSSYKTISS